MGKVKFFFLHFHTRSRIYHAGENLSGYVVVDLKEAAQVQGIVLYIYEKPCIRYVAGTGPGCCSSVFTEVELIGAPVKVFPTESPGDNNEAEELDQGFHTINFSIPLPSDIPSSFETKSSKVQYYLVAELELAGSRAAREKTKSTFKVINTLDLSLYPEMQVSRHQQAHVGLTAAPLPGRTHAGDLDVVFHVDKGGYVPGEKVKIYGKINNGTSVQIRKSYVELVQIIKLRTSRKVKTVRNPVTGLRHHSIPAGATDVWDTDCLTIPELPPTNNGTFAIAYCLQLVILPAGLNQKVKLPIEIVIGTVQGGVNPCMPLEAPAYLPYDSPETLQSFALGEDQFDIINSHGGRIQLQIAPPPYIPTDEHMYILFEKKFTQTQGKLHHFPPHFSGVASSLSTSVGKHNSSVMEAPPPYDEVDQRLS